MVLRLPRRRELRADAVQVHALFLRRERGVEPVEQQARDPLVLAQHRAARALGGMGGEHRLDLDLLEQLEHRGEIETARLELGQRRLDAARLRSLAGFEEIAAAPADAVHLLREVHGAKPHRERAREIAGHRRRASSQLHGELGGGGLVAGAALDR
jgi:hypothetical protein